MNFYKRKGVQVMRAKPVLPADYQPSTYQLFQRQVFRAVIEFAKTNSQVQWLINNGWGGNGTNPGASNLNNFVKEVIMSMTRDKAGVKLPYNDVVQNLDIFLSDPNSWFNTNCQQNMSKYPMYSKDLIQAETVAVGSLTGQRFTVYRADIETYRNQLSKFSQAFVNTLPPGLLVTGSDVNRRPGTLYQLVGIDGWEGGDLNAPLSFVMTFDEALWGKSTMFYASLVFPALDQYGNDDSSFACITRRVVFDITIGQAPVTP